MTQHESGMQERSDGEVFNSNAFAEGLKTLSRLEATDEKPFSYDSNPWIGVLLAQLAEQASQFVQKVKENAQAIALLFFIVSVVGGVGRLGWESLHEEDPDLKVVEELHMLLPSDGVRLFTLLPYGDILKEVESVEPNVWTESTLARFLPNVNRLELLFNRGYETGYSVNGVFRGSFPVSPNVHNTLVFPDGGFVADQYGYTESGERVTSVMIVRPPLVDTESISSIPFEAALGIEQGARDIGFSVMGNANYYVESARRKLDVEVVQLPYQADMLTVVNGELFTFRSRSGIMTLAEHPAAEEGGFVNNPVSTLEFSNPIDSETGVWWQNIYINPDFDPHNPTGLIATAVAITDGAVEIIEVKFFADGSTTAAHRPLNTYTVEGSRHLSGITKDGDGMSALFNYDSREISVTRITDTAEPFRITIPPELGNFIFTEVLEDSDGSRGFLLSFEDGIRLFTENNPEGKLILQN